MTKREPDYWLARNSSGKFCFQSEIFRSRWLESAWSASQFKDEASAAEWGEPVPVFVGEAPRDDEFEALSMALADMNDLARQLEKAELEAPVMTQAELNRIGCAACNSAPNMIGPIHTCGLEPQRDFVDGCLDALGVERNSEQQRGEPWWVRAPGDDRHIAAARAVSEAMALLDSGWRPGRTRGMMRSGVLPNVVFRWVDIDVYDAAVLLSKERRAAK